MSRTAPAASHDRHISQPQAARRKPAHRRKREGKGPGKEERARQDRMPKVRRELPLGPPCDARFIGREAHRPRRRRSGRRCGFAGICRVPAGQPVALARVGHHVDLLSRRRGRRNDDRRAAIGADQLAANLVPVAYIMVPHLGHVRRISASSAAPPARRGRGGLLVQRIHFGNDRRGGRFRRGARRRRNHRRRAAVGTDQRLADLFDGPVHSRLTHRADYRDVLR